MAQPKEGLSLEVVGDEELARSLGKAAEAVTLRMMWPVTQQAGLIAANAARARAPRRSGALAASGAVVKHSGGAGLTYTAVYAPPIHWGWPAHHIKSNPWLLDAARATEPRWAQLFFEYGDDVISKIHGA